MIMAAVKKSVTYVEIGTEKQAVAPVAMKDIN
jgi:hypothetical protein